MRLIDAELLEEKTKLVINLTKMAAKLFCTSDEEDIKAIIEAYEIFLDVVKDSPTVDTDDGWIPYTGQPIENGRYLVQTETGVIVCGTYKEHGFVFPFCSDVIEAFRPLPKPYEQREETK